MYQKIMAFLKPTEPHSLNKTPFEEKHSEQKKVPIPSPSSSSPEETENTWVFIWNLTSGGVGHAAMQIGGSKPKMSPEDPGEYISIHPDWIPAMGPTSILPLPATLSTTLTEDMITESASKNKKNVDFDSQPSFAEPSTTPLAPDQTFKLDNLDTASMLAHIKETREGVKSGDTSYQLFPGVNMARFFRESSFFVNQDPLDVAQLMRSPPGQVTSQAKNCTTLVSDILNSGGAQIVQSKMPWIITPNDLADQIKNRP